MVRNVSKQCPDAPWCDQGQRPHTRHEVTLGTWRGSAWTGGRGPRDLQLVVHGLDDVDARPMIAIIDKLEQVDVVIDWQPALALGLQLVAAVERFQL